MKKLFKMFLAVLCIIPCAFFMVACGDGDGGNGGNGGDIKTQGYSSLKTVASKTDTGISAGKTMVLEGSQKTTYLGVLEGEVDEATKAIYDSIFESAKKGTEENYQVNTTMAYKADGTAVIKFKYNDSVEADGEWTEDNMYVIIKDNDYLKISVETYPEVTTPTTDVRLVDKDYFAKSLELNNFDNQLEFYDYSYLEMIRESADITAFEDKMKELICELERELGDSLTFDKINTTVDMVFDENTQVYTLKLGMVVENLVVSIPTQPNATSSASIDAKINIQFTTDQIVGYSLNATSVINVSSPISTQENAPKMVSTITSTLKSDCTFIDGVSNDLWDSNLNSYIPVDKEEITPVSIKIRVYAFDKESNETLTYTFNNVIDFEALQKDLLANSIISGFQCENGAVKSVKYYLDKDKTKELNAENITKYPSYDLILYADVELNDNYSIIRYNYGEGFDMSITIVSAGELDLSKFLCVQTIAQLKVNGQIVDTSSGYINIEGNHTYILEFTLNELEY